MQRILRRKVARLGAIGCQVKELQSFILGRDELPLADANGAISFMSPPQVVMLHGSVAD
jgi:hypothetical protein